MPIRPLHQCRYDRCQEKTNTTYCLEHTKELRTKRQQRADKNRGSSSQRGYDYKWQKYRIDYLKENPLCKDCLEEGRYVSSKEIDHVIPISGPEDHLFWDPNNHRALCKRHHSAKTMRENR